MAKGCGDWRKESREKYRDRWHRGLSLSEKVLLDYVRCNCYDCGVIEWDEGEWEHYTGVGGIEQERFIEKVVESGKFLKGEEGDKVYLFERGFIEYQQSGWYAEGDKVYYERRNGRWYKIGQEILKFEKLFSELRKYIPISDNKRARDQEGKYCKKDGYVGIEDVIRPQQTRAVVCMDVVGINSSSLRGGGGGEGVSSSSVGGVEMQEGLGDAQPAVTARAVVDVAGLRAKHGPEFWEAFKGNALMKLNAAMGNGGLTFEQWCHFVRTYPKCDHGEAVKRVLKKKAAGDAITDLLGLLCGIARKLPDTAQPETHRITPRNRSAKERWIQDGIAGGAGTREQLETAWIELQTTKNKENKAKSTTQQPEEIPF